MGAETIRLDVAALRRAPAAPARPPTMDDVLRLAREIRDSLEARVARAAERERRLDAAIERLARWVGDE